MHSQNCTDICSVLGESTEPYVVIHLRHLGNSELQNADVVVAQTLCYMPYQAVTEISVSPTVHRVVQGIDL